MFFKFSLNKKSCPKWKKYFVKKSFQFVSIGRDFLKSCCVFFNSLRSWKNLQYFSKKSYVIKSRLVGSSQVCVYFVCSQSYEKVAKRVFPLQSLLGQLLQFSSKQPLAFSLFFSSSLKQQLSWAEWSNFFVKMWLLFCLLQSPFFLKINLLSRPDKILLLKSTSQSPT